MNQQQPIRASPDATGANTFKEEVLGTLLAHLETDGSDKAEDDFNSVAAFFSRRDGWAEIEREARIRIAEHRRKEHEEEELLQREEKRKENSAAYWTILQALQEVMNSQQGKAATETASTQEEPLRNIIFNERIYNTNAKLHSLRQAIASAIKHDATDGSPADTQELRLDPMVQSEWYYILKSIEESNIAHKFTDREFIIQMVNWFPQLFTDTSEKALKRLAKSISGERGHWRMADTNDIITLKDMWAKGVARRIGKVKAQRIFDIAYKGLYSRLTKQKDQFQTRQ